MSLEWHRSAQAVVKGCFSEINWLLSHCPFPERTDWIDQQIKPSKIEAKNHASQVPDRRVVHQLTGRDGIEELLVKTSLLQSVSIGGGPSTQEAEDGELR